VTIVGVQGPSPFPCTPCSRYAPVGNDGTNGGGAAPEDVAQHLYSRGLGSGK
jgi:hypothetical protein